MDQADNNDYGPEVEKKTVPTAARFLTACRRAWQKIPSSEDNVAMDGGQKFREAVLKIIPKEALEPNDKGAAEPPQRRLRLKDGTERFFSVEPGAPMVGDTAWDRFGRFKEVSSFGAKSGAQGLHVKEGNITSVRDRVFGLLMEELEPDVGTNSHPGFCPAPLPRTRVAMPLQASMFYTSKKGQNGRIEGSYGLVELRRWLVALPSEEEQRVLGMASFAALDEAMVQKTTLTHLLPVGGFSHNAPLSSVCFAGGGYLSALSLKHLKATATRLLKSNESHNRETFLSNLFGSKVKRDVNRADAENKAKKRHGVDSPKVQGPDVRVPVAETLGCVTDERLFRNVDILREKGKFFKGSVEENLPPDPGGPVLFTILLQSLAEPNMEHVKLLLAWLKEHPLVVLDPGQRWIVYGVVGCVQG